MPESVEGKQQNDYRICELQLRRTHSIIPSAAAEVEERHKTSLKKKNYMQIMWKKEILKVVSFFWKVIYNF